MNLLNILYFVTYLFWLIDWLKTVPALKGPEPALDFGKAGLEGLPRPGNTGSHTLSRSIAVTGSWDSVRWCDRVKMAQQCVVICSWFWLYTNCWCG